MKSKLLILSLLFCFNIYGQSVPNTSTFTLQDVVNVTGGTSLTEAFTNATGTFDPAYVGSKNSLYNFRNYQSTINPCSLSIGSAYGGGVIAYFLQSGDPGYVAGECHGLIAAASDQSSLIGWDDYPYYGLIGGTNTAIGTGLQNTNTIVSVQGSGNYAALICYNLVLNGYSDWYLPSKDELYKLYLNRVLIGNFVVSGGQEASYWSSSEANPSYAWLTRFFEDTSVQALKANSFFNVRAVRSF